MKVAGQLFVIFLCYSIAVHKGRLYGCEKVGLSREV